MKTIIITALFLIFSLTGINIESKARLSESPELQGELEIIAFSAVPSDYSALDRLDVKNYRVSVVETVPRLDAKLLSVENPLQASPDEVLQNLSKSNPGVLFLQNRKITINSQMTTNYPRFNPSQWALQNNGSFYQYSVAGQFDFDVDGDQALKMQPRLTSNDEAIKVAVIDTGVNIFHNDLSNQIWRNKKEIRSNGIDDDQNGYCPSSEHLALMAA